MDTVLESACSRVGWTTLYAPYFPNGLPQPSNSGEIYARSPFPFSNDTNPSFQLNIRNGLWTDFHAERILGIRGGNLVQFIAFMTATRFDENGAPVVDFGQAERELKAAVGIGAPINAEWLANCRSALADYESQCHRLYRGRKPWSYETLVRLGIGWDVDRSRFAFPTQEANGSVANCRMYRLDGEPKILWANSGYSGNFLFPHCGWTEPWVILTEGEPDAISLRSMGYNGISGTMGSGNPVPEGSWWIGKRVWIWMDVDAQGQAAQENAARIIRDGAAEVRLVETPIWEGRPHNADCSDWIMYLFGTGLVYEQIQAEITRLLSDAPLGGTYNEIYESDPIDVRFVDALTARNADTRIQFTAHVVSKSDIKYSVPSGIMITCPGTGFQICNRCPMHTQYHGNATINVDPRSPLTLRTIMVDDAKRDAAIRTHMHIPTRCNANRITINRSVDLGVIILTNTMGDMLSQTSSFTDQRRYEGFVLLTSDSPEINESQDYSMVGYVRAMPASQKSVLFIDSFQPQQSSIISFEVNAESRKMLEKFQPAANITAGLVSVANDISSSRTMIRGRLDLHLFFRCIYHSVITFNFAGSLNKRGWLEGIIVGDTRCGKSATFTRMTDMFGTGILVDSKMQTPVGLLGSVESSNITGERYVVAGLFPRQDSTGPICLDEYSPDRGRQSAMMDCLSSTRSSGVASITKAASASFSARVRLILMANPGAGRLMRDIGGHGVEILKKLIPQPEDIARFDIGMAVSQEDVPLEMINNSSIPTTPIWTDEDHRALLAWTWSRRPDQVVWNPGAEDAVIQLANHMIERYDADIPLVEPADQRMKIAKLAVSVAAQCYSTDITGELLVVRPEHIYATAQLLATWYDKPSFAYDKFSERARLDRNVLDPLAVMTMLDNILGPHAIVLAETLSRTHIVTERTISTILPMKFTEVQSTLQTLMLNRCLRISLYRADHYEITPAFVGLLKEYISIKQRGAR